MYGLTAHSDISCPCTYQHQLPSLPFLTLPNLIAHQYRNVTVGSGVERAGGRGGKGGIGCCLPIPLVKDVRKQ